MPDVLEKDYATYKEIICDLLQPISTAGLDYETSRRLYESKLVYLENLRIKCFLNINKAKIPMFSGQDLLLIREATELTRRHLRAMIVGIIEQNLSKK